MKMYATKAEAKREAETNEKERELKDRVDYRLKTRHGKTRAFS